MNQKDVFFDQIPAWINQIGSVAEISAMHSSLGEGFKTIGTCPLIWNDDGEKAEEIRRFVDIPWSEQIVAIIQVGHYATNECKYAASNRRAVFDVLKIH